MASMAMPVIPEQPRLDSNTAQSASDMSVGWWMKLPWTAQYVGVRRARHFSKVAFAAAFAAIAMGVFKYVLAVQGEEAVIAKGLQNSAVVLASSMQMQMESDFATLDNVANLWHLDSRLDRAAFRKFIKAEFNRINLRSMQTIILIQPSQREAVETHPPPVKVSGPPHAGSCDLSVGPTLRPTS
eukprot:TRINITY_DN40363_c0_g1_i2.p1 TRINITY_DN40363_c0_g1~~TRINITY_DN40363_c0_g1_i2.p1  ORF type:complete len:184 (+),score=22.39 TRINITY_DN40363_c0_g1_i2:131-682(+)